MTITEAIAWLNTDDYESVGYNVALEMAIKALEQTRWIPVSERLPEEDDKEYLVTMYSGGVYDVDTSYFWHLDNGLSEWSMQGVIAWQPLPEPYKEG